MLNIQPGMEILDVGCGVGGPAREIATFTDCHVVGLNNNAYQIMLAQRRRAKIAISAKGSSRIPEINLIVRYLTC